MARQPKLMRDMQSRTKKTSDDLQELAISDGSSGVRSFPCGHPSSKEGPGLSDLRLVWAPPNSKSALKTPFIANCKIELCISPVEFVGECMS